MKRGIGFAVALLCLWITLSHAATYSVATTGNDASACRQASPCRTFARALPLLRAGDTLLVRGGTYAQDIRSAVIAMANGTATARITVQNFIGETVWIQPSTGCNVLNLTGVMYWTFQGINIDGRNLSCGIYATNGVYVQDAVGGSHIILRDLEVRDISNNSAPLDQDTGGAQGVQSGYGIQLINLNVHGTHKRYGDYKGEHCVYMGGDTIIDGGQYHNCGVAGIQFNDSALRADHPTGGMIRNARIYKAGRCIESPGPCHGGASGIVLYANQRLHKVYNNLIYDNRGPGIQIGWTNTHDNQVLNNTIVGNAGNCLGIGSGYANVFVLRTIARNNVCKNNGGGIVLTVAANNSYVQNNIIHGSTGITNSSSGSTVSANLLTDPLLVNIATQDFHLQATSPAINMGTSTAPTVTTDFAGIPRPQGAAYDIGAYELSPDGYGTPPQLQSIRIATSPVVAGTIGLTFEYPVADEAIIDRFVLQRRRIGQPFTDRATTVKTVRKANDPTAENGVVYCYRVLAEKGARRSEPSGEVCGVLVINVLPLKLE